MRRVRGTPKPRMRIGLILVLGMACWCLTALPANAASTPLHIQTTCFRVIGPNGVGVSLFGRRYSTGTVTASTPAVLLVHGIDSSADTWDLVPTASPARMLARAGYLVFTYDRLGYKHSRYSGNPKDLTLPAQQLVLHQIVVQIHRGHYAVRPSTITSCAGSTPTPQPRSRNVALIGHSSGGVLVAGYPGRFHDVAALVVANAPSGLVSLNPPGDAALLSLAGSQTSTSDPHYVPVGSTAGDRPAPKPPAGYSNPLPTRSACEQFMLWRPGALSTAATVLCNPANAVATPDAETRSYPSQILMNLLFIPATGATPVLLADSDHDTMMPGDANTLELSAWRQNCRCDVSQFVLTNTGHSFMSHRSVTQWVTNVTAWLRSHHLAPSR
ncbi:MAG: alpha/beta hydrolase [Marmoricola sp.]